MLLNILWVEINTASKCTYNSEHFDSIMLCFYALCRLFYLICIARYKAISHMWQTDNHRRRPQTTHAVRKASYRCSVSQTEKLAIELQLT